MITNMDTIKAAGRLAEQYKAPEEHVLAVIDVESDGKIYASVRGKHEPYILFEPHKFYQKLPPAARAEAIKLKIASKEWNPKLYPGSQEGRWDQMNEARALLIRYKMDPNLAYECASWGVGQVLGEHWDDLGFESVEHFVNYARMGVEQQADLMFRYCVKNGLLDELQDGRWQAFARGYNGKSYKKNRYDTRLAEAALSYGGKIAPKDGMLHMGSTGEKVRELQALLVRAGWSLKVDGDFGPATKKAVRGFQQANGITVDGVVGPETMKKLAKEVQSKDDKPGAQKVSQIKEVIAGAVVAVGGPQGVTVAKTAVEAAKTELGQYSGLFGVDWLLSGLGYVSVVLVAAGVGYAVYGWWKSKQTKEV